MHHIARHKFLSGIVHQDLQSTIADVRWMSQNCLAGVQFLPRHSSDVGNLTYNSSCLRRVSGQQAQGTCTLKLHVTGQPLRENHPWVTCLESSGHVNMWRWCWRVKLVPSRAAPTVSTQHAQCCGQLCKMSRRHRSIGACSAAGQGTAERQRLQVPTGAGRLAATPQPLRRACKACLRPAHLLQVPWAGSWFGSAAAGCLHDFAVLRQRRERAALPRATASTSAARQLRRTGLPPQHRVRE